MAKGQEAKQHLIDMLSSHFKEDFIGVVDKKVYLWLPEDGGKVQIALTMTCPKNPIGGAAESTSNEMNFGEEPAAQVEIGAAERENIEKIMERLGL